MVRKGALTALFVLTAAALPLGLSWKANEAVFLAVNGFGHPVLDRAMLSVTELGNALAGGLLLILLALPARRSLALRGVLALLAAGVLSSLVKETVSLPRPASVLGGLVHVVGPTLRGNSFPSGHTTTAFALAFTLAGRVRVPWSALFLSLAALVGFSRVSIGAHFPLDVCAGALVGLLAALLAGIPREERLARLGGAWLDRGLLALAVLMGVWVGWFEPLVRYNPVVMRSFGILGSMTAAALLVRTFLPGSRKKGGP